MSFSDVRAEEGIPGDLVDSSRAWDLNFCNIPSLHRCLKHQKAIVRVLKNAWQVRLELKTVRRGRHILLELLPP